jgi:hypothetical protein
MQLAQQAVRKTQQVHSEQAIQRGGRRPKMATLKATGCRVGTQSITIFFSEKVDATTAQTSGNYNIFAPDAGLVNAAFTGKATVLKDDPRAVLLEWSSPTFAAGQWVLTTISGLQSSVIGVGPIVSDQVSGRAPSDSARITRDVEDAISYPVLTEEVAYRPSPVGIPTTGAGGISGPGGSNLGQVALQAVSDVLGWKANPADPKGFIGALTQSFTLSDVEGHVEAAWKPRSYAVQTDLGGGITGAQASLYMRAKDALDQSLTLLDGLYPLDPEADPEYVKALREMARSQMTEIVKELGVVGLPSILRINTYFSILLGQKVAQLSAGNVQLDPDQVNGTLGKLRDIYGIYFRGNEFNNSVQDEQDITNFRVISDYMTSLCQSWIANREFFLLKPKEPAFFGTQLVLISRQFNVIAETVNELRFALDSVFIGPNERQTLLLEFEDHSLPPMFLEDVLDEIDSFVTDEGPRLLRDGGKISVTNNIRPVVDSLRRMVQGAHHPKDQKKRVPDGFRTARVRHALDDVEKQLTDLVDLTRQVEQEVPPSEDKLAIDSITQPIQNDPTSSPWEFSVYGNAFDPSTEVTVFSTAATGIVCTTTFVSAQRIDVSVEAADWLHNTTADIGNHDVVVTNRAGETASLSPAFYWDGSTADPPHGNGGGGFGGSATKAAAFKTGKAAKRQTRVTVSGAPPSAPTDQQLKDLGAKTDKLENDLKGAQTELSKKIDDLQKTLEDSFQKALAAQQESMLKKMEDWRSSKKDDKK